MSLSLLLFLASWIIIFVAAIFYYALITYTIRRLHDIGLSGWYCYPVLLFPIPLLAALPILCLVSSKNTDNKYINQQSDFIFSINGKASILDMWRMLVFFASYFLLFWVTLRDGYRDGFIYTTNEYNYNIIGYADNAIYITIICIQFALLCIGYIVTAARRAHDLGHKGSWALWHPFSLFFEGSSDDDNEYGKQPSTQSSRWQFTALFLWCATHLGFVYLTICNAF